MNDILSRFTQRSGEPLISWVVRIYDAGAAGILIHDRDAKKSGTISNDSFVQQAFRDKTQNPRDSNLLELVAEGCLKKYLLESTWPGSDHLWYTLKDCIQRLKEEAMKSAIFVGHADEMSHMPLTVQMRNKIFKTAPPSYKRVILTLLLSETGVPINEVIDKVCQMGDIGEWNFERKEDRKQNKRNERVSRKDMFMALLKEGVPREKIDGVATKELWDMYRKKGLDVKKASQNTSVKKKSGGGPQTVIYTRT